MAGRVAARSATDECTRQLGGGSGLRPAVLRAPEVLEAVSASCEDSALAVELEELGGQVLADRQRGGGRGRRGVQQVQAALAALDPEVVDQPARPVHRLRPDPGGGRA